MSNETLMTEQAATTTEGQATSQTTEQAVTATATQGQEQKAPEGQNTEAKTDDGAAKTDEGKKPEGAPEKYEFKAAEGREFDGGMIEQFSEVARELNLPQDAAQKILDKMAPALEARQTEVLQKVQAEWTESSKADKEFGGEKLNENLAHAKTALEKFGTPELRTLLNESGLGNHPEVIRFMVRTGKAIGEDTFVSGKATSGKTESIAQRMYPDMNP